jgi:hypothetical protein
MGLPYLSIHFSFSSDRDFGAVYIYLWSHVCVFSFILVLAVIEFWVLCIFTCGHVCESSRACSTEDRSFKTPLSDASVES